MNKFIIISLLLTGLRASGQITVSGRITDQNKKPVRGVSVSLKNTYDGTTSDSLGRFSFMTSEKGKQILYFTGIGFESLNDTILIQDQPIERNFTLYPQPSKMDPVVITAGSFEAGDQNKAAELTTLDVVTTASANADITSAIKTLPGSQQVGDQTGLFVRGGTGNETHIFIDGSLVNNFFYSSQPGQASRGRFNPFLFTGVVFSSGGYSALYGQAMSSVLLLQSIDLPERTSANFGASYLGLSGGIQKLSKNKKSSWGLTYSYTNLALVYHIVKQKMDYFRVPLVHEVDGNFRIKTKRGIIKFYSYLSFSNLGYRYDDIDSVGLKNAFSLKNLNTFQNLSWKERIGDGWNILLSGSFSTNHDKIENALQDNEKDKIVPAGNPVLDYKTFNLDNSDHYLNGRWVLEKKLGGLSAIRFGNEYNYSNQHIRYLRYDNQNINSGLKENLFASYVESDVYLLRKLALRAGFRAEHSGLLSLWNAAPRVSFAYQFKDRGQVSFAYGKFFQDPDNQYLPSTENLHFENAAHYIVQYQKIANSRIIRAEVFYKKYDDLIKADGDYGKLTAVNNKGFGDAKGIEFFWRDKKTIKNLDYWISYSYLDTKRNFLNYPYEIQPPFAATNTASVVMKKFIGSLKAQINLSYTFASGRPYYDFSLSPSDGNYEIRRQGKTKDYNDLSLSINYLPNVLNQNAKSFSVFVLSVTNVPGFKNVYSYDFSYDGKRMRAVLPPAKRFYYLGWFISFGIDRTQETIDNQL